MSKRNGSEKSEKAYAIVPWGFHELVSILREIAGYQDYTSDPSLDEQDDWLGYVQSLDPKDWKEHDFYATMGLKRIRHRASDAQIKNAYRKLILVHHPDKNPEMHNVFICIQRANTYLSDPDKRKSYDSVDPENDDTIPTEEEVKENFYSTLAPVFYENSKWSRRQPVPQLGNEYSDIDSVEQFYHFWNNFDSWREFSFLDKEESEENANREQRRYVEKLNKSERLRLRQEEMRRIRRLVELAYTNDPRIRSHQQALKDEKERKRVEKQLVAQKKREFLLEEKRLENERLTEQRLKEEAEQKRLMEERRREKESSKSRLKKERKQLRNFVQNVDFFIGSGDSKTIMNVRVRHMQLLDLLCTHLEADELENLNSQLANEEIPQAEKGRVFLSRANELEDRIRQDKEDSLKTVFSGQNGDSSASLTDKKWTFEMNQCLVKAVNSVPPGSAKRWDTIAIFINNHVIGANVTGKDVLKRVKSLKTDEDKLKVETNKRAASDLVKQDQLADAVKSVKITERCESAEALKPWTPEEQKRLEEALRKFPGSVADRWDKISDFIGDRSKKECMIRYKYLVEMLKNKKS